MSYGIDTLYIGAALARDATLRAWVDRQLRHRGWRLRSESYLERGDEALAELLAARDDGALLILCDEEFRDRLERRFGTGNDRIRLLFLSPGSYPRSLPLPELPHRVWQLFYPAQFEAKLLAGLKDHAGELLTLRYLRPGWIELMTAGASLPPELIGLLDRPEVSTIPRPSLVRGLIDYFTAAGKTLTFAESCTGGRLAAAITAESGSSAIFEGSFVTYANRIKAGWLGVENSILERYGAVSAECVRQMAAGAREKAGADIAVAISGIAGPTGAVAGKPVGTVYFCVRNGARERTERLRLSGDRNAVQEQAVLHALKMIVESEENIFRFFSKNS